MRNGQNHAVLRKLRPADTEALSRILIGKAVRFFGIDPTKLYVRLCVRTHSAAERQDQTDLYNKRDMSTRNHWWSWEERGLQPCCIFVFYSSDPQSDSRFVSRIPTPMNRSVRPG